MNKGDSVPTFQPWENASSPFFLSRGDKPGVSLVVQHLTEENCNTWSRAVLISLDAKTKLGSINGSIPKPQSIDHPLYIAWCKCNNTVLAWLFNSVSKHLQPSIVYFKTTREVWLDLQYRYGQGNVPRILELRKEVSSLTQEYLSINAYYTKFKGLWDEFSNYRTCICGHHVEDCTMSFSMGLNETMLQLEVFSPLLQDEKQRKVGAGNKVLTETAAALAVLGPKFGGNAKNFNKSRTGRPQCTHYGAMGHIVDKCYKLHGYPPGYKFKNKNQSFASNLVAVDDSSSEPISFTRAEYQQLVGLMNSQFWYSSPTRNTYLSSCCRATGWNSSTGLDKC
ncbi:uncharacterized protein LOC126722142 [Quercus robur]|uniref:uncharacterized protein LOC126722142 n=1 Tax=Quercus robur TaxID=38942 RepID=UPI002162ECDB|nr:uncharacterized protein LOC126722142 [Quercus robur]